MGGISDPVRLWWQSLEWGFTRWDGHVPKVLARLPLGALDHKVVRQHNVVKEALGQVWVGQKGFAHLAADDKPPPGSFARDTLRHIGGEPIDGVGAGQRT